MKHRNVQGNLNGAQKVMLNVVEYIKKNNKKVIVLAIIIFAIIISVVSIAVYAEIKYESNLAAYEEIMKKYEEKRVIKEEKASALKDTVAKIENLMNESFSGYIDDNGYYIIAGLYYSEKKYKDAKKYYLKFIEESSTIFTPLALRQIAICEEWENNFDSALKYYQKIEKEYADSYFIDQNTYDIARMYQAKSDIKNAKDYYKKLITMYPKSVFVKSAKKRLYVLNIKK